jgi:hypothetical protein
MQEVVDLRFQHPLLLDTLPSEHVIQRWNGRVGQNLTPFELRRNLQSWPVGAGRVFVLLFVRPINRASAAISTSSDSSSLALLDVGYAVQEAGNGVEALAAVHAYKPDPSSSRPDDAGDGRTGVLARVQASTRLRVNFGRGNIGRRMETHQSGNRSGS